MKQPQWQSQQEQEQPPQRNGPPAGWRYYAQGKHRSRLRGWLVRVWRGAKNNAALVSAFLALFGVLVTLLINTWLAQQEQARQQALENDRAQRELALAEQQAQQESLQTYLGDMGELILRDTPPLREASAGDEVSRLARAKTLTVLLGLDGQSKRILLQFLKEEALINAPSPIVNLSGADLSYAELSSVDKDRNLFHMEGTDLEEVNLYRAQMRAAVLAGSELSNANLSEANLILADLGNAILRSADLSGADLSGADLSDADLSDADLSDADLSKTDLSYARGVTEEELEEQALTLQGATMPDGSVHP